MVKNSMTTSLNPTKRAATRGRGRPSKFTEALAEEIRERLSKGEPLAQICRDDHMPHPNNVREWMARNASFAASIACAREDGMDAIVERMRETARGRGDSIGDVQRDKLIVETDLKLLAKWDPKRYGDKIDVYANQTAQIRIVIGGNVDPAEDDDDPDSEA
jgi:hypothetical protein